MLLFILRAASDVRRYSIPLQPTGLVPDWSVPDFPTTTEGRKNEKGGNDVRPLVAVSPCHDFEQLVAQPSRLRVEGIA
ncbi:MAG: hypothetical protein WD066_18665, partial [Planctomycetaceae bacterium]